MVFNFSVIPIPWVLTVNSEMAFFLSILSLRVCLFSFKTRAVQQKFIAKLVFQSKFHSKNPYHTDCFVIHAISVFRVKLGIH